MVCLSQLVYIRFQFLMATTMATSPVPTIPVGRGPPAERAVIHNVHIYDNQNPHQRIGGLHLTNGVTKVLFYHMVGILIRVTQPWSLRDESNRELERKEDPLLAGNYFIVSRGQFAFLPPSF